MRLSFTPLAVVALAGAIAVPLVRLKADATEAQQTLPKGQMPELGRPTKVGDELPLFNFDDYFAGKWTFEWDMPDGPLGESGRVTGTTIYKVIEPGKTYQADTDATGPDGPFRIRETIAYQKDAKTITWQAVDSRGFTDAQAGTIGGDLGGIYNILLEGAPFTYKGHSIRIKRTLRTMSPFNYKVSIAVSADGGPYRNYGNPWWRKDPAAR